MGDGLHCFIVPAYGESPYLEECLRSLACQTIPSPVLITTSTPSPFLSEIARRHRVGLLVNPECRGIASDWSFAYAQGTTKYVTLAHQDDHYAPGYAARCLDTAERFPDNLITFTDYQEQLGERRTGWNANLMVKRMILLAATLGRPATWSRTRRRRMLAWGCAIPCPSVMYHRQRMGAFSFSEGFVVNLDWDAWARLAQQPGCFCRVPESLMTHRIHAGAETSRSIEAGRRQREDRLMFERFWPRPVAALLAKCYRLSLVTARRNCQDYKSGTS